MFFMLAVFNFLYSGRLGERLKVPVACLLHCTVHVCRQFSKEFVHKIPISTQLRYIQQLPHKSQQRILPLQFHKLFDKSWIAQPSKFEQIQVLPNFAVYNVLVEVLYGFKRNVVPELFVINLFASILCIILN